MTVIDNYLFKMYPVFYKPIAPSERYFMTIQPQDEVEEEHKTSTSLVSLRDKTKYKKNCTNMLEKPIFHLGCLIHCCFIYIQLLIYNQYQFYKILIRYVICCLINWSPPGTRSWSPHKRMGVCSKIAVALYRMQRPCPVQSPRWEAARFSSKPTQTRGKNVQTDEWKRLAIFNINTTKSNTNNRY